MFKVLESILSNFARNLFSMIWQKSVTTARSCGNYSIFLSYKPFCHFTIHEMISYWSLNRNIVFERKIVIFKMNITFLMNLLKLLKTRLLYRYYN